MTYVALLRGINVGGNRKVDMKQLEAVFERAGMSDVRTYINSGNVVFCSDAHRPDLVPTLESAIERGFGFPVRVMLRDAEQIAATVSAIPSDWAHGPDARCDVVFLGDDVDDPDILDALPARPNIDDVRYVPGALLWRVERSKLTRTGMTKIVGTPLYGSITVRNCNTARKLHELMHP